MQEVLNNLQKYYFRAMEKNKMLTIESNVNLKPFNTFGLEATAKDMVRLRDESELPELLRYISTYPGRVLFIGGGSNLLFTNDLDGLLVKVETKGIKLLDEDDDYAYVRAEAGEVWDDLVQYCIERGYGGIENLSLIPGTVGSSPIQNIGAYGVELKDSFFMLEAVSVRTGEIREFCKDECQFDYRYSIFKGELKGAYLILSVILRLSKKPVLNVSYGAIEEEIKRLNLPLNIKSISKAVISIRNNKLPDPKDLGSAGSFFKNPVLDANKFETMLAEYPDIRYFKAGEKYKLAAGWLIESCGFKGYRQGDAGVYSKQALVLVNYGHATGHQIKALADHIIASVHEKYGITLEPEVNIL